jgi:hypothetical protein
MDLQNRVEGEIILSLRGVSHSELNRKMKEYDKNSKYSNSLYDISEYISPRGKYLVIPERGRFVLQPIKHVGREILEENYTVNELIGEFILPETYSELKEELEWRKASKDKWKLSRFPTLDWSIFPTKYKERKIKVRPLKNSHLWFQENFKDSNPEGSDFKISLIKSGLFGWERIYLEEV